MSNPGDFKSQPPRPKRLPHEIAQQILAAEVTPYVKAKCNFQTYLTNMAKEKRQMADAFYDLSRHLGNRVPDISGEPFHKPSDDAADRYEKLLGILKTIAGGQAHPEAVKFLHDQARGIMDDALLIEKIHYTPEETFLSTKNDPRITDPDFLVSKRQFAAIDAALDELHQTLSRQDRSK